LKFSVLVHSMESVNEELKKGHYFFGSLYQNGVLLFDNNVACLSFPRPYTQSVANLEKYWQNRYQLAEGFLKSASHAILQGWNGMAVFMLHQSVEHICIAMIRIHMGYKTTTHNLSRLIAMVENFSLYSITVFPRITPDEVRVFNILEKAYSHARYDDDYAISSETVNGLKTQVEELLEIGQAHFLRKLQRLNFTKEKQQVSGFDSIGLDTFARVVLRKGEQESVEIESEYDSGESILVKVESEKLWISTTNLQGRICDATVYITYKKLSGLVVHHVESLTCNEPLETEWLGIVHNGPGNINLAIDVLMLDVTLNKNGNITLSGSADEAKIFNNRTGDFDGKDLETTSAKVILKGSGNVSVQIEDELQTELHGSGNLIVTGSPRIKSMTLSGSGKLTINN
jgi:HEPN domain-containing protein